MRRISSLAVDGTEPLTERTVPQVHKSVVDYLVSNRPDQDLRIELTEHNHSLTTACLESIQRLTFNIGRIETSHELYPEISSISQDIAYSCEWFGDHLENGGERATLVPYIETFMETHFLQWLEVLSLQKLARRVNIAAVRILTILEKKMKVSIHLFTKYSY